MAAGRPHRQSHQPLASSTPLGGADEDTDKTVPDHDNDDTASFISEQTTAIDTPNL